MKVIFAVNGKIYSMLKGVVVEKWCVGKIIPSWNIISFIILARENLFSFTQFHLNLHIIIGCETLNFCVKRSGSYKKFLTHAQSFHRRRRGKKNCELLSTILIYRNFRWVTMCVVHFDFKTRFTDPLGCLYSSRFKVT